ncbi:MAG: gamma-glutamylcyclotransferase family protein [Candidatus Thiodiazotropha sp.]
MSLLSRVFVYGTLRRNEVNHYLLEEARYCGTCLTPPRYKMVNLGAYPGVVRSGGTCVEGEVYQVSAQQLADLDRLEGYPHAYCREVIATPWGKAWIYLYRGSLRDRPVIPGGIWRETIVRRRWSR